MCILEFSNSQYNYFLLFCVSSLYIKEKICNCGGRFCAIRSIFFSFLFFTENQLFGCPVRRCIFDMDCVFGCLLQSEASVCVLHMIAELIVGRDKLNGYTAISN